MRCGNHSSSLHGLLHFVRNAGRGHCEEAQPTRQSSVFSAKYGLLPAALRSRLTTNSFATTGRGHCGEPQATRQSLSSLRGAAGNAAIALVIAGSRRRRGNRSRHCEEPQATRQSLSSLRGGGADAAIALVIARRRSRRGNPSLSPYGAMGDNTYLIQILKL
jgi:hypothetical protein